MDRLAVSTVVYRPPAEVYDFLLQFTRYPRYSRYLKSVDRCEADGTATDLAGGEGAVSVPGQVAEATADGDAGTATPGVGAAPTTSTDGDADDTPTTDAGDSTAGGPEYDLRLAWWKIGCSMRSRVVETVRPERIDWRIVEGVEAAGRWQVSPAPAVAERECVPAASRVRLEAAFDPHSCDGAVSLPDFLALDRAIAQVKPLLVREIERMVVRAVRDLEGEARDVTISVEEQPAPDLL